MRLLFRALLPVFILCAAASAHEGEPLEPHDFWFAWVFDPWILAPLAASAMLYAAGARPSRGVSPANRLCFWSGWIFLTLSLVSPIHPAGEVLFSMHMVQHEILMVLAAPLLVLSKPLVAFLWALPPSWRTALGQASKAEAVRVAWRALTRPFVSWSIHAAALWIWHVPAFFQATLGSDLVHSAQHLSFLGSALLFWWSLFQALPRERYGAAVLYIFTTAIHTSILGALLTFATTPWYPAYQATTRPWGLTPLEDQQIGGLIMWIPPGVVYLAAGLVLFHLWLRESDAAADRSGYAR